jgi:hypothetical protein
MKSNTSADVFAREETWTRKWLNGYDPTHIDETALQKIAKTEKLRKLLPINTGVVLLKTKAVIYLAENQKLMIRYLQRLIIWMCENPIKKKVYNWGPAFEIRPVHIAKAMGLHRRRPLIKPLRFPSHNRWIAEEVALWLTIGSSELTSKYFWFQLVMQGDEFTAVETPDQRPYLIHYLSRNTKYFRSKGLRNLQLKLLP